jgi:hypothetical protein
VLYARLLRGNMFWRETSGATISLTQDEPPHVAIAQPLLWRGQNAAMLAAALESFADTVERWMQVPDGKT